MSIYLFLVMIAFCISCKGQVKTDLAEEGRGVETKRIVVFVKR